MTRKDEILARVMALASIMLAEGVALETGEWNALLADRWCKVSYWTTRRDLEALTLLGIATSLRSNGVRLYRWRQWPVPLV